jgi:hypothetical protein
MAKEVLMGNLNRASFRDHNPWWRIIRGILIFFPILILLPINGLHVPLVWASTHHQLQSHLKCNAYRIKSVPSERIQTIEMENFATISAPGKPMLPYMVKEFILPGNVSKSSVKLRVIRVNSKRLPGKFSIKAAPRAWKDR